MVKQQERNIMFLLLTRLGNTLHRLKVSGKFIIPFLIVLSSISARSQTFNLDSLLTPAEINWLNKNKDSIKYAPNPSWPPGDYMEDGIHKGFVSDYIKLFEEMLGIDFVKVYYQSWTEILNGLKNSEIDFVGAIHKTDDRENYLLFTEPFKKTELGIITQANYDYNLTKEHINNMSLACVKNYSSTQFIRREYPDAQIKILDDDFEALQQTSFGITDGAVIDLMTASYLLEKYGISNLKTAAILDFYWELRFASRNELPELNSIINKLLKTISEEQHKKIFKKWVNIDYISEPGFFEKHQKLITGVVLFILFLLVILFIFNYSLKKQINKQTFQLKKARDTAIQNEEKYRLIAENTTDVVWLADLDLNTTYMSPSVEKMLGGSASDHLGKTIEERFPSYYIEKIKEIFQEELKKEKEPNVNKNRSRTLVLEHFRTDGSTIWVEINVSFIRDKTGNPVGLHGITRDISESKKARDYIEKRLAMEKLLSQISKIAIEDSNIKVSFNKILKKTGLALDVSRVYIFEYDSQSDTVSNTFEWCATGIKPQIENLQHHPFNETPWFFEKLKQGKVINYKNIEKIPDNATKDILRVQNIISILVVPLTLNNRFYGFIGFDECKTAKKWQVEDVKVLQSVANIVTSLTERHKTEKELRIKDRSIELSLVAKAISDLDGKITYANQAFLKYWKYEKLDEIIGKTILEFWESNSESRKVVTAIRKKGSWQGELKAIRPDGTVFDALVQASVITSKDGKPLCMQASFYDITERKTWEQDLIIAKEKAEESDRLKSAFLANMSHEIRTPMNGILGFTELLLEPDLSSEQKEEFINIVHQSGRRMLNTVNDIVEISKIEAGIVTMNLKEVNVQERLDELIRFFTPEATKKGLKLTLEKEVPKTATVFTSDQNKLDSILTNLIKNAIKYTRAGEISVGCKTKENMLEFFVKDTGIGIPAERQKAVFERFIQADITTTRQFDGSGLGLAISKAYLEMLGGEIWVESKPGEGSAFFFTLPLSGQISEKSGEKETGNPDEKSSQIKGLNIVIAEDDETSAIYLQTILQSENSKFIRSKNGLETVEFCRNNPDIDLVLMDIQMPGIDGYEATRQIRQFNKNVIIIAQTAFAMVDDREKALEAGCNDYISKPFKKDNLVGMIQKYFKK